MADILTYAAGRAQGQDGLTDRERLAGKLMDLAQSFSKGMHKRNLNAIAESHKAAQTDIIQNTVDPKRQENDEAYAATTLRNQIHGIHSGMMTELDNPASEAANTPPKDFAKGLATTSKDFYSAIQDSPFAATQSEVYRNYTFKNQPGLVAKQAQAYKENMKVKQSKESVKALAGLPQAATEELFNANTTALITRMLPPDRFTSEERLTHVMSAAIGAAHEGDERLLNYADEQLDAGVFMPVQMRQGKSAMTAFRKKEEAQMWMNEELKRQQLSEGGEYTVDMRDKDATNPDVREHFSMAQINGWYKKAHDNQMTALNMDKGIADFKAGVSFAYLPSKDQQAIMKNTRESVFDEVKDKSPEEQVEAISQYAALVARQNIPDKELKQGLGAMLNRPVYTKEAFMDPAFQQAAVAFRAFSQVMTPEQLQAQFGDDGIDSGYLVQQALTDTGGDVEKAADSYLMVTNREKDQPALEGPQPRWDVTQAAVQEILSGNLLGHDPAMTGFAGWGSKTDNAVHTSQLSYEFNKAYGMSKRRGLSDEAAAEASKIKVAANAKFFGNELVWTDGTNINTNLFLPEGLPADGRQKTWESVCNKAKVNPDKAHFAMYGQYGYITDADGEPIGDLGLFPLQTFGVDYRNHEQQKLAQEDVGDTQDNLANISTVNRALENLLVEDSGGDDSKQFLPTGETVADFKYADEDKRLRMRRAYNQENRTWIGKTFSTAWNNLSDWMTNPENRTEGYERWKTVATDASLAEMEPPPPTSVPSPPGGPGRENEEVVKGRAEGAQEFQERLMRSRDGEVKLTAEEERMRQAHNREMGVEEFKAAQETTSEEGSRSITDVKAWKKDAPDGATALEEAPITKPQDLSPLESALWDDEGAVGIPYTDSAKEKNLTIGVGHKIEKGDLDAEEIKKYGKNRDWKANPMTTDEAKWQLRKDIKEKTKTVKSFYGKKFDKLSDGAKTVAVSMFFQLKNPKAFKGVRKGLIDGNYDDAVAHMIFTNGPKGGQTSDWWEQTPGRIRAHANRLGQDADAILSELQ